MVLLLVANSNTVLKGNVTLHKRAQEEWRLSLYSKIGTGIGGGVSLHSILRRAEVPKSIEDY